MDEFEDFVEAPEGYTLRKTIYQIKYINILLAFFTWDKTKKSKKLELNEDNLKA